MATIAGFAEWVRSQTTMAANRITEPTMIMMDRGVATGGWLLCDRMDWDTATAKLGFLSMGRKPGGYGATEAAASGYDAEMSLSVLPLADQLPSITDEVSLSLALS